MLLPLAVVLLASPSSDLLPCAGGETLSAAVEAVFGAGTTPASVSQADLAALAAVDLERLYLAAPPPALASVTGLEAPATRLLSPGSTAGAGRIGFRAPALTPERSCAGFLDDGPVGDLLFRAYQVPSFFDGCPTLRLDHDLAPHSALDRRRKTELRALHGQLLLGVQLADDVVDTDGWPVGSPASVDRFVALDLSTTTAWQDPAGVGWPWSGSAPTGGTPPPGWTPAFAVDPSEWPFAHQVLETRHGRVHYADEEPIAEPRGTVLFVHGNPTWGFLWRDAMAELLADGWRVVAPDHLGFGLSDKPALAAFPYAPRDHAEVLEDFVQALDLQGVTLVIHDWGVPTGLALAGRLPERVRSIVLTNGWGWNFDATTPGEYHQIVDWSLANKNNPAAFLFDGSMPLNVASGLAFANGQPGSPEYAAALAAWLGPFFDLTTGLPLSTDAIYPTWLFAVELLEDRDFMTAVELDLAQIAELPLAFRFGATDRLYGALLCDEAPQPACSPGLSCSIDDQCVDADGDPSYPVIERFEDRWSVGARAGRRLVPVGHFVPEGQGPGLAADVRYLEHFAGSGCGAKGSWPRLSTTPLALGTTATLAVEGAAPAALGVLYGSLPPSVPLPLAPGCEFRLDAATLIELAIFATDGFGNWSSPLPAPANPAFAGMALRFQAFVAADSGAVSGFDVSNGAQDILE